MKLYDVEGYDRPLRLSDEHAELLGGVEHSETQRPTQRARVAEWRDYAISLGVDADIAAQLTRAELIEQYGDI